MTNSTTTTANHPRLNYRIDSPAVKGSEDAPWLTLSHSMATDISMWEPQLAELSKHFRVLSYDTRGHGASEVPAGPYVMQDLVDDLIHLWDQLDIETSHIVGLSMGGMIGTGVALHAPERVNKLLACDCRLDAPEFFVNMWHTRMQAIADGGIEGVVEQTMNTWFTQDQLSQGGPLLKQVSNMIINTPAEGYLACAQALQGLDYKKSLPSLQVPTRFLVGDQDGPHPEEMRKLAELTPGSELITLKNAAHLSSMEQPQAFTQAVLDYLL
jgi:3-oxoadipate enol-lactonase